MARDKSLDLPLTQIHLDFHTSGLIPNIGADFDAEAFAHTFARAHVGQVTVFAKCHHGWSYYPTDVGRMHPNLSFDLMGRQIEALQARGIRAPAYISVGYDELAWREDPALEAVAPGGRVRDPLRPGWHTLCLNAPAYLDYVAGQAAEVLDRTSADGLFFDIMQQPQPACMCPRCIERMDAEGVDPADAEAAAAWQHGIIREACQRLAAVTKGHRQNLSVFFNSCFDLRARDFVPFDTHVDVESLPTGGWGYMHFPVLGRFARIFGKTFVGMTARFHHHWGDFGGLKPRAALEQECFHALMLGGKVNVGDHLDPRGRPEPAVYERIGEVFRDVMRRAPWCEGAQPIVEAAVLAVPEPRRGVRHVPPSVAGAVRMLAESHVLFDVIDAEADLKPYKVLILPDGVRLGAEMANKLQAYLDGGGTALATAWSGLAEDDDRFVLKGWPATYAGEARHSQPFLLLGRDLARGIPDMPHALYVPGPEVRAVRKAKVLARLGDPHFSRTRLHFSGHEEAPLAKRTRRPAIVRMGNVAYARAPLFTAYAETAYPVYRQIVAHLLDALLEDRALETDLPTTARATMLKQGRRRVVHLASYVPERRTDRMDIIEDRVPLHDVGLSVAGGRKVRRVYLAPQERDLAYEVDGGRVRVTVPVIDGHQMVVVE